MNTNNSHLKLKELLVFGKALNNLNSKTKRRIKLHRSLNSRKKISMRNSTRKRVKLKWKECSKTWDLQKWKAQILEGVRVGEECQIEIKRKKNWLTQKRPKTWDLTSKKIKLVRVLQIPWPKKNS